MDTPPQPNGSTETQKTESESLTKVAHDAFYSSLWRGNELLEIHWNLLPNSERLAWNCVALEILQAFLKMKFPETEMEAQHA
jgi:hypothetical protein